MPLKPGFILRNRYRIESVLGQGGMGAVYRAVDVNLGVTVAVKENLFTTEEFARQFRREATILASLRHPNLPRVTDHFVVEGEGQYLVMDFVQGDDLRQKLERGGPVREEEALPWFLDAADALAYLHSRTPPVLHRDVKPGNIKITPEGRAVLVDFGLAKVVEEDSATTTGAKAMTPGFSPPEQYGSGRTDPRTDIYSLGATLYAALTATIPEDSLERAMGRAQLTPVRKRNANVSAGLARVVEKALAVKPEERYQSMAELAGALGASTSTGQPTVVRSYAYLEQTRVAGGKTITVPRGTGGLAPVRRRRRWPVLLVGLVTVGLTVAGAIYALSDGGDGGTSETPSAAATVPVIVPAPSDTSPAESPTDTALPPATEAAAASPDVLPTQTIPVSGPTPMGGGIGQIAFASTRAGLPQVFLANIDGTGVKQLTTMTDGACQPSWSPDGQRLVFTSPCREDQDLYPGAGLWVIQADGSGLTSLPSAPGGDFDPAWSPDGTRIAFASLRDHPNVPHLYVISPLGTDVEPLTEGMARDSQPAWAPTGTQLAFVSHRAGVDELWLLPDFGADALALARGDDSTSHPDWSHDGRMVVFERKIGGIPRLVAMSFEDRASGAPRLCPQGPLASQPMSTPKWSSDDRWLVFETWPDGVNHEIGIMTTSCANYGLLTEDPGQDFDPAWRP